jgi:D-ribose pyranose/furanose isomerase RbsD
MKESEKELQKTNEWKDELKNMMPFLGHRNWIVVTDMAYPLQSKDAITTLYANEPYIEVVREIKNILSEIPHVTPQIYQDRELSFLNDEICPEIDELKKDVSTALSPLKSTMLPHEELISTLDSTAEVFKIIIIKTNLTKPYTTIFFRLDCKYWDAEKQKMLDEIMSGKK